MKKLLATMLAVIMIAVSGVTALAEETQTTDKTTASAKITFKDVTQDTPGYEAIYKLVNAGVVNGHGDGTFKPNDSLTRAELTKIINLTFGYTEKATENFNDVKNTDWYYEHTLIAKKAGYIVGFPDGSFGGEKPLTREQVCMVINRCVELMPLDLGIKITDEVSDWAQDAVNKVVSNMLMPLEQNNTFRATKNITRTELAQAVASFVVEKAPETNPSTNGNSGTGNTGSGNSSSSGNSGSSGNSNSGSGNGSGNGSSGGSGNTGTDNSGSGNTGTDNSGSDNSGSGNTGSDNSGSDNTGSDNSGSGNTDSDNSGSDNTGSDNSGSGNTDSDNSGSSNSGSDNTGDNTPSFDNSEIVENLENTLDQVWGSGIRYLLGERAVLNHVKEGIEGALSDADDVELTKEYIKETYSKEMKKAREELKKMTEAEQSAFYTKLANAVDLQTLDFLNNYFLDGNLSA